MMQFEDNEVFQCDLVSQRQPNVVPLSVLLELRATGIKLRDAESKQILLSLGFSSLAAWSTRDDGMLHLYSNDEDEQTSRWTLRTDVAVEIAAALFRASEAEAARGGVNVARMRGASIEEQALEGEIDMDGGDGERMRSFVVEVEMPSGTSPARLEVSEDGITLLRDLATGCNVQHYDIDDMASWKHTPSAFMWYVPTSADVEGGADLVNAAGAFRKLSVNTREGEAIEEAVAAASALALDDEKRAISLSQRKSCAVQ